MPTKVAILALCCLPQLSFCQSSPDPGAPTDSANAVPHSAKRIFGIIPNFRTSPTLDNYQPISAREKFHIATQDAFDRGTFVLSAAFAGQGQLTNTNRSFGQGVEGYSKYLAGSYAGFVIGDYMTEGVFPAILHQDPRYFRRNKGSALSRLGYSMGQIFWTHRDSGRTQFNFSEVVGNSTAVAISNIYYKDSRTARDAVSSLGVQLGVDMASNILKEFWPDFERKFRRKHSTAADASGRH